MIKAIRSLISDIRWIIENQRFKKNRFKRGRGGDFHGD
ncbi:hypothetical protein MCETOYE15_00134 [Candidatus Nanopelagicaceae bacterium]